MASSWKGKEGQDNFLLIFLLVLEVGSNNGSLYAEEKRPLRKENSVETLQRRNCSLHWHPPTSRTEALKKYLGSE